MTPLGLFAASLGLAVALAPGASVQGVAAGRTSAPTLRALGSVEQLKAEFNRSGGHVRLILLLSPT